MTGARILTSVILWRGKTEQPAHCRCDEGRRGLAHKTRLRTTNRIASRIPAPSQPCSKTRMKPQVHRFCRLPGHNREAELALSHPAPDSTHILMQNPWILAIRSARPRRRLTSALVTLPTIHCKLGSPRQFASSASPLRSSSPTLQVPNPAIPPAAATMAPKAPKFEIKSVVIFPKPDIRGARLTESLQDP
jgi:hypothetical protein